MSSRRAKLRDDPIEQRRRRKRLQEDIDALRDQPRATVPDGLPE
jgi:hypothetical protein